MTNTPTRILLVDDTQQILDMMVLVLPARLNIPREQIDTASDAYEALDFLAQNSYKLVFTDNDMPGKTGLELIREIRSNPSIHQPKIIMMSGDGGEVSKKARAAGANAFLDKPANTMQIVAAYCGVTGEGLNRPASNDATVQTPKTGTSDPEPSV